MFVKYFEMCEFYSRLEIEKLLDLRAQMRFGKPHC